MTEQELFEIERQVAERVMGWKVFTLDQWLHDGNTPRPHCLVTQTSNGPALQVFEESGDLTWFLPTRNIVAAWRVVDKMREKFSNVSIHIDNGAAMQMFHIDRTGDVIRSAYGENAETVPLAICLAALKAMEGTGQ